MKSSELRLSDTNSADDSDGHTWGFDGGLFWVVAAGSFLSVATLLVMFSALHHSFPVSAAVAAIPSALSVTYVVALRRGKPPGYDKDLLETWIAGAALTPDPKVVPKHPLLQSRNVST
jgi:hypothetical protein